MSGDHALLSPSSSARWMVCAGSIAATVDVPDSSNVYAREGDAAHQLAHMTLEDGVQCQAFMGLEIPVPYHGDNGELTHQVFTVNQEMVDNVQVYVDAIRREPGEKMYEEQLDLSPVYGVEDQFGTSDTVVLDYENATLGVHDLKYGMRVVMAQDNPQLLSYAAAALLEYEGVMPWEHIKVAIHQPRTNHYDEVTYTRGDLYAFISKAKAAAKKATELLTASAEEIEAAKTASPKACEWCPLRGNCIAETNANFATVMEDFRDVTTPEGAAGNLFVKEPAGMSTDILSDVLERLDMVDGWSKAVRAEGLRRLQGGLEVPRHKLVRRRQGNLAWLDEAIAEDALKKARLKQDEMYDRKLISPTTAKKVLKSKPRHLAKVMELVTRSDGKLSIAHESEKGDPVAVEASFKDVS